MNFGSSSSMRPESLPQGCCQLFEHLFLAGAALWDPHLTAGLYQKASPILLSIDVQHDVVFDSIEGNVRALRSNHSLHAKPAKTSGNLVERFVRPEEQNSFVGFSRGTARECVAVARPLSAKEPEPLSPCERRPPALQAHLPQARA